MTDEASTDGRDKGWREKLYLQGWRLWVLVAVVAYTLVGFLLVPWIARSQAPKMARESLGIDLAIERIRFNPYLFKLSVEGLSATDPQTGPLLDFDRLFVDFELSSLWKRAWTFREISLEHPHARLVRFADGRTNVQAVLGRLPEAPPEAEPEPDAPPPRVMLQKVSLTEGRADLEDRTRPTPWSLALGPVSFSLDGFGTLTGQQGNYALEVTTERGGFMTWNGTLAVGPFRSAGNLGLRNLDVVTLWSYVRDDYDADVNEAPLNVSFAYAVDAGGDELSLDLSSGNVDVADLEVTRRSTGEPLVSLRQVSAAGIEFDLATMAMSVGAVEIIEPTAHVRRLEDGTIDLAAAFAPRAAPDEPAGEAAAGDAGDGTEPAPDASPEAPGPAGDDAAGTTGDAAEPGEPAGNASETDGAADPGAAPAGGGAKEPGSAAAETPDPAPPAPAGDADTPGDDGAGPAPTAGEAAPQGNGASDETGPGEAGPDPPAAQDGGEETAAGQATDSSETPGAAGPPPGAPEFTLTIDAVSLQGGTVTFEDRAAPRPVNASIEGINVSVSDYASADGHRADVSVSAGLASGGSLSASGPVRAEPLDVGLDVEVADLSLLPFLPYADGAANLVIDSVKVGAVGRVTMNADEPFGFEGRASSREFSSRLPDEEDAVIAWNLLDAERVKVSMASNSVRVGAATLGRPFVRVRINEQGDLNLTRIADSGDAPADAAPAEAPAGDETGAEPMSIGVGQVNVIQGEMDFRDLSLPLPFAADVRSMKGTVSAITSGSPTPARIEIDGNVNEYGASTIRGTLDLFDPTRLMDLEIDFRNIQMPTLTPYTAKFAGRRIDDGTLDVDLSWSIRNSQLEASNRMVIQDLELGEKVEAEGAMSLPLDLAVALLTDSQGRIDLDVPVSGDLDNPEFRYAPLVFKALGNLLAKIVTAPFRFLAGLVGGDGVGEDQLEFVGFVAGDAKLLGPEQQDLDTLAQALAQRPTLALSVGAAYDPERDAAAIRQDRLDETVSERFELRSGQDDDGRDPVRAILEELYTETAGPDAVQALQARFTSVPEGADKAEPVLDESAYLEALRNELLAAQPVSQIDLELLGQSRAQAVRDHLANVAGLDPARLSLQPPGEAPKADENLVFLKLDVAVPSQ